MSLTRAQAGEGITDHLVWTGPASPPTVTVFSLSHASAGAFHGTMSR
jgi:hypothetical protein